MMNRKELLPTQLERTVVYECPWVNLYRDKIRLSNGHIIEQYHILDFGPGTVTAVVENEAGQILMTLNARYPTKTVSWELPAGGIDTGETPLEAARREVLEETGYDSYDHRQIYAYHPLNGIANMTAYVTHCRAGELVGQFDDNEVQAVRWFGREELLAMIARQEIPDGYAVIGLLLSRLLVDGD